MTSLRFSTGDLIHQTWPDVWGNEVHAFLLQEKTFEAPLSLFFQFSTAFYLSDNPEAFAILLCSIFTSLGGITHGLYIANHLSFVDVEEVDLDLCHSPQAVIFNAGFPQPESNSPQNGHPAPQAGLQPTQLPPPPGSSTHPVTTPTRPSTNPVAAPTGSSTQQAAAWAVCIWYRVKFHKIHNILNQTPTQQQWQTQVIICYYRDSLLNLLNSWWWLLLRGG